MRTLKVALIAAVAAVSSAAAVNAATVTLQYAGATATGQFQIVKLNQSDVLIPSPQEDFVHQFKFTNTANSQEVRSYCMELTGNMTTAPITYTVTDLASSPLPPLAGYAPMGADDALSLRKLYTYVTAGAGVAGGQFSPFGTSLTENQAVAFQLAVWNIIYDDDASVSSGIFFASQATQYVDAAYHNNNPATLVATRALADSWLGSLGTISDAAANSTGAGLVGLTSAIDASHFQDQLYYIPPSQAVPVPAASLGGLALIGLQLVRRARAKA